MFIVQNLENREKYREGKNYPQFFLPGRVTVVEDLFLCLSELIKKKVKVNRNTILFYKARIILYNVYWFYLMLYCENFNMAQSVLEA